MDEKEKIGFLENKIRTIEIGIKNANLDISEKWVEINDLKTIVKHYQNKISFLEYDLSIYQKELQALREVK